MLADNSHYLTKAAQQRAAAAHQRAKIVLRDFDRSGEKVSLALVARRAKVSRTYLYSQPDLLAATQTLIAAQAGRPGPVARATRSTEASLLSRIAALTEKNKRLRLENADLRKRLEAVHEELREARPFSHLAQPSKLPRD